MRIRPAPARGGACHGGQVDSHIDHSCQLLPKAPHISAASTVRVLPIVKDSKAVPQEVGPASRVELGTGLRGFRAPTPRPSQPSSLKSSLVEAEGVLGQINSCPLPQAAFKSQFHFLLAV